VGIEGEGLAVLPPWQKLYNFSIRAEKADIENAEGSTSDTQPVKVSMTVRYSIATDKVAEVFEKYSHDGDLSSYVQLAAENKLKTVEAEQKQKVAVAEAEAKATIATAQATAQSLRIQNEALARNKDVLDLRRIEVEKIKAERWDGKLPTNIYSGAPIPFLNLSK
jgi:hypothetical protein